MSPYPIETLIPHQHSVQPDGSHCCGCWKLQLGDDDRHYAECNECGLLPGRPLPPSVEAYLPESA